MKLPIFNQAVVKLKNQDKLCGNHSLLVFLHPPRTDLNTVSKYTKSLKGIKTDGIDLNKGLNVDDMEEKEEQNNLKNGISNE